MSDHYSTYEAKTHLSALLRQVREGRTVYITHRGKPVAELRPVKEVKETMAERLERMERTGELVWLPPPSGKDERVYIPGALARFLADRG